jgi:ubiquinone/menaquinone biosynthesis C-methylase UbiE
MDTPKDLIGHIVGGRVLDVATGGGGFIQFLVEGLKDYTEIVGIDSSERAAVAFEKAFAEKPAIHFQQMDAGKMDFPAETFDTVCMASSLHHLDDPQRVLGEMQRVLKPGGHWILVEMFCDGQSETQLTHVLLHHWWAAVDSVCGIVHHETYPREEIVNLLSSLELKAMVWHDLSDTSEDPLAPEVLAELGSIIDRYIQRADGYPDLQARGEILRKRVHEVGFHGATALMAVGVKAGKA